TGRRWGRDFRLGATVIVTIQHADPITGLVDLALHEDSPESFAEAPSEGRRDKGSRGKGPRGPKRGGNKGRSKAVKKGKHRKGPKRP
ncbi:MAG: hypothetical protein AAF556_09930, partial [Pseudomonadota bacterium]